MSYLNIEYFSKPLSVAFYITFKCNLECMHCALNCSPNRKEEVSLKAFKKIIEKLWKSEVFEVGIIGGEPLVHPDIISMFKILHDYGFTWTLSSNGVLLKEKICENLIRYSPKSIHISLHGYPSKVHNSIVGSNCFDTVLKNIENIKSTGISVVMNTVLHKLLCDQILNFINFLKDKELKTAVNPLIPLGRAVKNWKKIAPSKYELYKALYLLDLHKNMILYETSTLNLKYPCRGARSILVIDPQGFCYPCDQAVGLKMFMNEQCNIMKRSLDDIWNGTYFTIFRKLSKEKDSCPALSLFIHNDAGAKFSEIFRDFYGFDISSPEDLKITLLELIFKREIKVTFDNDVKYRDEGQDIVLLYNKKSRKILAISKDLFNIVMSQEFLSVPKDLFSKLNNALESLVKEGFLRCIGTR